MKLYLKKSGIFLTVVIGLLCLTGFSNNNKVVSVKDFGAIPDDNRDDSEALRKACAYCRHNSGIILFFPSGVYNYSDEKAKEIEFNAVSGNYGENTQGVLFKPDAPYVKALDLSGARNLTVEASGATLCLNGWYEPISLVGCSNVIIRGLSITYMRPPNTVGKVENLGDGFFDISFDPLLYTDLKDNVTGGAHFYDNERKRLYTIGGIGKKELIRPNVIRIACSTKPKIGDYCIIRHSGHYRPAVLIKESSNIKLEDVKIHEQPGMGVVGHRSENITLKNVQIVPIAGRFISTNTDATHFTSCKGRILMDGCKFEGQGDDCTNIHNYYYTLYPEKAKNQICIKVENADLHALSLDYPDKGDTLNLVSRETLEPIGHYIVKDVKVSEKDWKVTVTLNKEIPSDYEHYYMTNESRKPSVALFNNTVRSHLARAFLIKTDNVQIKGNVIQNCTGTAIQIGAEGTWRECGPVKNLMIEDNWFIDCGYDGHGTQENTSAICINISGVKNQTQGLHRNITIRNNNINAACENAIYISSAQNINVINNNIANCKNSVFIQYSKDILIRNNGTIPVKIGDHVECQNVR